MDNQQPKIWKTTILVWVSIVPLVFTVLPYLSETLISLGVGYVLKELIVTTALVLLMSYVCLPILGKNIQEMAGKVICKNYI